MSKPKRSTTLTLRLDQEILDVIREEAERHGISINVLVNRELRKYAHWGRFAERYGLTGISKNGLRRLLSASPEEKLRELAAQAGQEAPRDLILFIWGEVTLENAIKLLHTYAEDQRMGDLERHDEDGKISFVLHHDMGLKRSIYLEAFFGAMFENLFNYRPRFNSTSRSVSFTIVPSEIRPAQQQVSRA
jgi:hypothetical protein